MKSAVEDPMQRVLRIRSILRTEIPEKDFKLISFLFAHLKRVSDHSHVNLMTPSNLAVCWFD